MGTDRHTGKRVLLTSTDQHMRPAIEELFADEGSESADLALLLASDVLRFIFGQAIAFAGGSA